MLANRIIKQLSNIPKGIYRVNCTPINHEISTKYQWDDIMVNVCYHRANNEWTTEQRKEIKKLLQSNEQSLVKSCSLRISESYPIYSSPYHRQVWLSGSQFILDDFPSETQWILKANSHFEETKKEVIEGKQRERDEFYLEYYHLCIDKEKFPSHHIWWETIEQKSRFDNILETLEAVVFDFNPFVISGSLDDRIRQWREVLEEVCIHRLAYEWTAEEKGKLKSQLGINKPQLVKYTRDVLCFEEERIYGTQKILSGLQFLLDDFPLEMQYLLEEEANLEEAKGRFERLAKEKAETSDDESNGYYTRALFDEVLVLNRATKPSNHTWWNVKLKKDYEHGTQKTLTFARQDTTVHKN